MVSTHRHESQSWQAALQSNQHGNGVIEAATLVRFTTAFYYVRRRVASSAFSCGSGLKYPDKSFQRGFLPCLRLQFTNQALVTVATIPVQWRTFWVPSLFPNYLLELKLWPLTTSTHNANLGQCFSACSVFLRDKYTELFPLLCLCVKDECCWQRKNH